MSRNRWGLKNPEKFLFSMPTELAELFRDYCGERHFTISKVLVDLVIDHLIGEGVIDSQTAVLIREGKVMTPFMIARQQQRAKNFAIVEAAAEEAEEFNSKQYKTGKQAQA